EAGPENLRSGDPAHGLGAVGNLVRRRSLPYRCRGRALGGTLRLPARSPRSLCRQASDADPIVEGDRIVNAFRREIVEALAKHSGATSREIDETLVVPPQPEMGDFAFPCFQLAKKMRQAPPALAQALAAKLQGQLPAARAVEAA